MAVNQFQLRLVELYPVFNRFFFPSVLQVCHLILVRSKVCYSNIEQNINTGTGPIINCDRAEYLNSLVSKYICSERNDSELHIWD